MNNWGGLKLIHIPGVSVSIAPNPLLTFQASFHLPSGYLAVFSVGRFPNKVSLILKFAWVVLLQTGSYDDT